MRSWFFLFSCNLMWSLQFTCIKLVQDQVGPLFTVWGPMTLATLMLHPLIRFERRDDFNEKNRDKVIPSFPGEELQNVERALPRTLMNARQSDRSTTATEALRDKRDILLFLLLAAVGVFPAQVMTTWGTRMSLASNAALLSLTLPICTALLAFFFLGERMTRVRWMSFLTAIAGVILCSNFDFGHLDFGVGYLFGNTLILLGVLGSAFYNSYGKKVLERYSPMEMLFYTYLAMFAIMTPLVVIQEKEVFRQIVSFSSRTWTGLFLLTFFHNYLSMVLFLKALRQLDATQAALSNYLITFFGLPIAALWLGERLTPLAIVGGIMVLGSTLMITLWEERRTPNFSNLS